MALNNRVSNGVMFAGENTSAGEGGKDGSPTSSAVGIKKFVRKTIFGGSSTGNSNHNRSDSIGSNYSSNSRHPHTPTNAKGKKNGVTISPVATPIPGEHELDEYNTMFHKNQQQQPITPTPVFRHNSSFSSTTPKESAPSNRGDYYTYPETASDIDFIERPKIRSKIIKLLTKADKAKDQTYRYEVAMRYYLLAMSILTKAHYPDDHPLT
eukprot:7177681-Ditylum_brightwellii.AAC.1